MAQHAGTAQREVLLGHRAAEPTAPASRDNERIYQCHARI
jgi:hypothetical protein